MKKGYWMPKYDRKPLPEVDRTLFVGIKGIDEIEHLLPHYYIKTYECMTMMLVWAEASWDGHHFRTIHNSGDLYKPEDCADYVSIDDPELDLDLMLEENKERMVHYAYLTGAWLERMAKENALIEEKKGQAIEEIEELG